MKINLIFARSDNGVIGNNGKMPWHIPQDLARFRSLTLGGVVIMGRKTYQSLPGGPLAGRVNIVITRNPVPLQGNVHRAASVEEALEIANRVVRAGRANSVWVIGGAEIYTQTLPLADKVYATHVHARFEGDAHFKPYMDREWEVSWRGEGVTPEGLAYSFVDYQRKPIPTSGANKFFVKAGRYLCWLAMVQLVAWTPALLVTYGLTTLNVSTFMFMALTILGAMSFVEMVARFGQFTVAHFRSTNRNPKE